MSRELLGLELLERPVHFILDTNSLNRFPFLLIEAFPCFVTQGVLEEHRRWISYIETLPAELEELRREIEALRGPLAELQRFVELDGEDYWRTFTLIIQTALEQRLSQVKTAEEWRAIVEEGSRYFAEPSFRAELDFRLKFAAAVLHRAARGEYTVKVIPEGQDKRGDLEAIEQMIIPAASKLEIPVEEKEGLLQVGRGSEELTVRLYSFPAKQSLEKELQRKELKRRTMEDELNRAVAGGELAHAREVVRRIEEQNRVLYPKWDPLTQSLWTYTRYLSKTLAREAVKEFAPALFGQDPDRVREEIVQRYAKLALSAERFIPVLDRLLGQIRERELGLKEIQEVAESFQEARSLEVDVGLLRAALSLAEEGEVFIVSDDQDIAELFTLTRQERGKRPVKYVSVESTLNFARRVKEAFDRIAAGIGKLTEVPELPANLTESP